MKNVPFLKTLFLGLLIFTGTNVMAQAVNGVMGGHCSCSSCNCIKSSGDCMVAIIDAPYELGSYEMPIGISITGPNTVLIEYQRALGEEARETLNIASALSVPQSIGDALGVSSIDLDAGVYTPDYSINPNGNLTFNAVIVP